MLDVGFFFCWFGVVFFLFVWILFFGRGSQWIGLGFLQECSSIPRGVTSRGALLMCKFEINRDGLFCSTSHINIVMSS